MTSNDQLVSQAFSLQSAVFDKLNNENKLTAHLRAIYREEVMKQAKEQSRFLELNCGTGIDTLFFANQGFRLLSTDIAAGMLNELDRKIREHHLEDVINTRQCSFNELNNLGNQQFDYIISNFGGLNCTGKLDQVLDQLKTFLTEKGKATLVIMPVVSPWELIMALKGDFKTAFRRFKKDATAHIEGVHFSLRYYNPSYIKRHLKSDFDVLTLKGIYFAVPPEFYQGFIERYPRLYKFLQKVERRLSNYFPFNIFCDHYLITIQKKS
ncbi:methyltransferase domain-containing protein [Chitinophaga oryziterrae]|uniref:Methyltransferase domain-containing protein n=1 Tax=Chitinophaga oryziterrae TaxID=1031224 RepID=A0A6N8JDG2_9BACT|nr:methyltransferase domain-containing protein [Chitinophaga oryziterrae]MVT42152.1 methyltransferase domain-containing protein [Chitinophaga oryziterrae]